MVGGPLFTSPLARRRLNGNYANLESGNTADALVNFTAGVTETGKWRMAPADSRRRGCTPLIILGIRSGPPQCRPWCGNYPRPWRKNRTYCRE